MDTIFCLSREFTGCKWFQKLSNECAFTDPVRWANNMGMSIDIPFVPTKGMIINFTKEQTEFYKSIPVKYGEEYDSLDKPCTVDDIEYDFNKKTLIVYMTA